MKSNKIKIFFIIIILFSITACHKRTLQHNFDAYSRIADANGKKIIFLNNYSFDTNNEDTLLILDIPPLALNDTVIFNFYQYNNENLFYELINELSVNQETNFFYFLCFYNNYTNTDNNNISYHLSIEFNKPVTMTYFFDQYIDENMELYKIKIPKYNEWGENNNIRIDTNYQAFPNGFVELDLTYLINGKWTENDYWGEGDYSLDNWEQITEYTFNAHNNSITFPIYNTDFMYVIVE